MKAYGIKREDVGTRAYVGDNVRGSQCRCCPDKYRKGRRGLEAKAGARAAKKTARQEGKRACSLSHPER